MYLLYLDESDTPESADERFFVLGGIAVEEQRPYWLSEDVNKLEQKFFPSGGKVEFHAHAITAHSQEPWNSMNSKTRTALLEELCGIVCNSGPKVVLFGVAVEKILKQRTCFESI